MQRKVETSLEYNRRAFELALQTFGGDRDHPKVLESEHNYAASLIDIGSLDEALPHLQRSLQGARTTYGEHSLLAAQYSVRLGLVLMEHGELGEAIELIETASRIENAFESGGSPSQAGRQRTLARAYLAAGRMADAERVIQRAIEIMRPFDAPTMMRVLEADHAFAGAAVSGALAPSIARLEQVIAAQDEGDSRYKSHLPDVYLGILHLWNGDPYSAQRHLDRGAALSRAQTRRSDLGEALTYLGLARLENGDAAGAEEALREGLRVLRDAQRAATPAQAQALVGLGRVALESADLVAALDYLREADAFWVAFDPANRGAGEAAYWLGRVQAELRQTAAASASLHRAADVLSRSPLPADAALAGVAASPWHDDRRPLAP
jgi:tetratricopeptide (TPR) repeat protein